MRNFNAKKVNNVKGSKKLAPMMIAAIVTIAGAATLLTGCGTDVPASSAPAAQVAVTTSASTTAATTSARSVKAENKTTSALCSPQLLQDHCDFQLQMFCSRQGGEGHNISARRDFFSAGAFFIMWTIFIIVL